MVVYDKEYFQTKGYDGYRDFDAHSNRVDRIIQIINPRSVLDVGCAYGYIVRRLLDKNIYAVGMDVSDWCEKVSKDIIPNNFVRHDMRETPYPFRDLEFDVVYCEGVLEHIEEEYIIPIMKEFHRIAYRKIIQVTFKDAPEAEKEEGHILLMDNGWWWDKVPLGTYLVYPNEPTDNNYYWLYKG